MLPALNIGPFVFPTAGLTIILGTYLALGLVERAARRLRQPVEPYYGLAVTSLLAGLIGARLVFVGLYWSAFQENLLSIVWPLNTGYHVGGGLFFAAAAAFFYGRFHQLPPAQTLDILAPGLLTALMVVSLADFLAGTGYGTLTTLPWGINFFGVRRHPVQLYELLLGIEALTLWFSRSQRPLPHAGYLFLLVTAVYATGRLFLDTFRATAWLTPSGWHGLQLLTLLIALTCLGLLAAWSKKEG